MARQRRLICRLAMTGCQRRSGSIRRLHRKLTFVRCGIWTNGNISKRAFIRPYRDRGSFLVGRYRFTLLLIQATPRNSTTSASYALRIQAGRPNRRSRRTPTRSGYLRGYLLSALSGAGGHRSAPTLRLTFAIMKSLSMRKWGPTRDRAFSWWDERDLGAILHILAFWVGLVAIRLTLTAGRWTRHNDNLTSI